MWDEVAPGRSDGSRKIWDCRVQAGGNGQKLQEGDKNKGARAEGRGQKQKWIGTGG